MVMAPLSLRNSITTSPSAGSSPKVGLMIGEETGAGSACGGDLFVAVTFGAKVPSLLARATAAAWTEMSVDMAGVDR